MGSVFARLDIADGLLNFLLGLFVQLLEILEEPLEDVLVGLTGVQLHPFEGFLHFVAELDGSRGHETDRGTHLLMGSYSMQ